MSLVTSSSPTTNAPIDSASGRTRFSSTSPWYVSAISAPCVLSSCAIAHARLLSLATPTTSARLPSAIPIRKAPLFLACGPPRASSAARHALRGKPFVTHEHIQLTGVAQSPSDRDFHQVGRHLHPDLALAVEHLAPEMGKDHSLGREAAAVALDDGIVEMKIEMDTLKVSAFAQEQIGARAQPQQLVGPSGVAREGQRFAADRHSQRERDVGLRMRRANGGDARRAHARGASGLELDESDLAHQGMRIHARIHVMKEGAGALLEMARTGDGEHALAWALPHVLQHQEGQSGEMVAMQVTDENEIEIGRLDCAGLCRRGESWAGLH